MLRQCSRTTDLHILKYLGHIKHNTTFLFCFKRMNLCKSWQQCSISVVRSPIVWYQGKKKKKKKVLEAFLHLYFPSFFVCRSFTSCSYCILHRSFSLFHFKKGFTNIRTVAAHVTAQIPYPPHSKPISPHSPLFLVIRVGS